MIKGHKKYIEGREYCLAHKIATLECGVCKGDIKVDRARIKEFIDRNECKCCGTITCSRQWMHEYYCFDKIDHYADDAKFAFDDIMPDVDYKWDHVKQKNNYGKKSKRIKGTKNIFKNKSYFKRRNDIKSNILSRNKWNKRYQLSLNGY